MNWKKEKEGRGRGGGSFGPVLMFCSSIVPSFIWFIGLVRVSMVIIRHRWLQVFRSRLASCSHEMEYFTME